ncbi:MAG: hypothetical protein EBZ49_00470 [Proteobacteria bacterium]|nr:hypothetical protein [Pseudomonadota bacterium]
MRGAFTLDMFFLGFIKRAYQESSDETLNLFFKPEKKLPTLVDGIEFSPEEDAVDASSGQPTMFSHMGGVL